MAGPNYTSFLFFKSNRRPPKRFSYKTKHYDEDRADLEARKRAIERKVLREEGRELDGSLPSRNIKFTTDKRHSYLDVRKSKRASSIRLFIILIILIYGFIYIMGRMDNFKELFETLN